MELMKNLRWVCRVCAVNIKRRRSANSTVPIFGTAMLNEKLKKYLDIHADLNDHLPKSICGECFRKIEWMHNFAQTAKKAQSFFMEFISIAQDSQIRPSELGTRFQSEFASFALLQVNSGFPMRNMDDIISSHTLQNRKLQPNNPLSGNKKGNVAGTCQMQQEIPKQKSSVSYTYPSNINGNNLEEKRRNLKALLNQSTTQSSINHPTPLRSSHFGGENTLSPVRVVSVPPAVTIQQSFQKDSLIYDKCLNLGRVIKDMDLLKLILKALKWPYTNENLLVQIQRLKDTPFRDVILDQNLLQDTDLMQILNTILSPILLKQQNTPPPILPPLVSYKIPADLSVHLITEEIEEAPKPIAKKSRKRYSRPRPKIIENTSPIEIPSDDSVQMFEVSIDPNLYFAPDSATPENSNSSESHKKDKESEQFQKMRRRQTRKEAHIKLYPEKNVEKSKVEPPSIVAQIEKETERSDKIEVKDVKVEKRKSAEIIIPDDISGDDDFWAELRVSESPDLSIAEHATMSLQIKSEPDSTNENEIINPVSQDQVGQRPIEEQKVVIKREIMEVEHEAEKIEKDLINDSLSVEKESTTRKRVSRKRKASTPTVKPTKQENFTHAESVESSQPIKPLRSKFQTNDSLSVSTRKSERKLIAAKSAINRKITRSISAAPPVMSLRNSNLRKRICKQCGMSFTKINDFMSHRKLHIQS